MTGSIVFRLYWAGADGRSELSGGEFATLEAAKAAKPEAERRFVAQGSGTLEDGDWYIEECSSDPARSALRRYRFELVGGAAEWWEC